MCSIPDARIALIGQAIDELAEEMRSGTQRAGKGSADAIAGADGVAQRLATLWAMVAELDPGLAERVARYAAPPEADGRPPG
jgi:hypothetical protein